MAVLPQGRSADDGVRHRSGGGHGGFPRGRYRLCEEEPRAYVENTGNTDLVFLALFKSDHYAEVSLSDWLTHTPPQLVMQHLNISAETLAKFPRSRPGLMPM